MAPRLRLTELSLLAAPSLWILAGLALLALVQGRSLSPKDLTPGLVLVGLALATHLGLSLTGFSGDDFILPIVAGLGGTGLVFIQRLAGTETGMRQALWMVIGFGVMAVIIFFLKDPPWLGRYKYTWALLGILLIGVTLILGKGATPGGPRLWLELGPIGFQPSEVLKVLLVIFFAGYLSEYQEILALGRYRLGPINLPPLPHLIPLLIMWGLSLMLLIGQRDLGAAFLFFGIFLTMLYIASGKGLYIWVGGVAFLAAAALAYRFVDIVQQRFGVWLDPWSRASGDAYQAVQGLMAFSAGGLLGTGLGYGQSQYIPAVHTDFIFAAIGEELGILGALGVLALYLLLAYRGYRIALTATNSFNQLLAAGLTSVLALQSLVILAGNLKLIPLTGVTLPFISYGGSSLVTNFVIIGLLLRLSEAKRLANRPAWPRRGSGPR